MSQPRTAIAPRRRHICSGTTPRRGSTPPPRVMLLGCSCDALAPRPPCCSRKNQHGETAAVSPRLQSRRRMPSPMGYVSYSFVCIMHACMYARLYVGILGSHTHTHAHIHMHRLTADDSSLLMHVHVYMCVSRVHVYACTHACVCDKLTARMTSASSSHRATHAAYLTPTRLRYYYKH